MECTLLIIEKLSFILLKWEAEKCEMTEGLATLSRLGSSHQSALVILLLIKHSNVFSCKMQVFPSFQQLA